MLHGKSWVFICSSSLIAVGAGNGLPCHALDGARFPIQLRSLSVMREVFLRSRWLEDLQDSDFDKGIAITHFPALGGRSAECDYWSNQSLISRRHCSFSLRDGPIWVQDLGSLNGTYLNGARIKTPRPL